MGGCLSTTIFSLFVASSWDLIFWREEERILLSSSGRRIEADTLLTDDSVIMEEATFDT